MNNFYANNHRKDMKNKGKKHNTPHSEGNEAAQQNPQS